MKKTVRSRKENKKEYSSSNKRIKKGIRSRTDFTTMQKGEVLRMKILIENPLPKMKKEESEPEEDISIVSRFSAFDISDSDTNLSKEHRNLKMTSKHSIEIRV